MYSLTNNVKDLSVRKERLVACSSNGAIVLGKNKVHWMNNGNKRY